MPLKIIEFWKGQLLELQTENGEIFLTQIIKLDQDTLYIQRPISRQHLYLPPVSRIPVTVYFHDYQQGLFSFESTIYSQEHRLLLDIPPTQSIKKTQRRRFFRVPAEIDVELNIPLDDHEDPSQSKVLNTTTKDISGGGLSVILPFKIKPEIKLSGSFTVHSSGRSSEVHFTGRTVNSLRWRDKQYKVALEFIDMNESLRSEIIQYCFNRQIELHQKFDLSEDR